MGHFAAEDPVIGRPSRAPRAGRTRHRRCNPRPTSSYLIAGRPIVISFATVTELRYGAALRSYQGGLGGWGELRRRGLERDLAELTIAQPDDELMHRCAGLVGGRQERWFLDNASSWADALCATGADVAIEKRDGEHAGQFWYDEFPLMVSWAFNG